MSTPSMFIQVKEVGKLAFGAWALYSSTVNDPTDVSNVTYVDSVLDMMAVKGRE
jgi:hypothetical protein